MIMVQTTYDRGTTIMVEAQHQEAIEQVILNLKAQVAGLNQQIEGLSKLLEV